MSKAEAESRACLTSWSRTRETSKRQGITLRMCFRNGSGGNQGSVEKEVGLETRYGRIRGRGTARRDMGDDPVP